MTKIKTKTRRQRKIQRGGFQSGQRVSTQDGYSGVIIGSHTNYSSFFPTQYYHVRLDNGATYSYLPTQLRDESGAAAAAAAAAGASASGLGVPRPGGFLHKVLKNTAAAGAAAAAAAAAGASASGLGVPRPGGFFHKVLMNKAAAGAAATSMCHAGKPINDDCMFETRVEVRIPGESVKLGTFVNSAQDFAGNTIYIIELDGSKEVIEVSNPDHLIVARKWGAAATSMCHAGKPIDDDCNIGTRVEVRIPGESVKLGTFVNTAEGSADNTIYIIELDGSKEVIEVSNPDHLIVAGDGAAAGAPAIELNNSSGAGDGEIRYVISSHGEPSGTMFSPPPDLTLAFFTLDSKILECYPILQTAACTGLEDDQVVEWVRSNKTIRDYDLAKDEKTTFFSGAVDCRTGKRVYSLEPYRGDATIRLSEVLKIIKVYHTRNYNGQQAIVYCLHCRGGSSPRNVVRINPKTFIPVKGFKRGGTKRKNRKVVKTRKSRR